MERDASGTARPLRPTLREGGRWWCACRDAPSTRSGRCKKKCYGYSPMNIHLIFERPTSTHFDAFGQTHASARWREQWQRACPCSLNRRRRVVVDRHATGYIPRPAQSTGTSASHERNSWCSSSKALTLRRGVRTWPRAPDSTSTPHHSRKLQRPNETCMLDAPVECTGVDS